MHARLTVVGSTLPSHPRDSCPATLIVHCSVAVRNVLLKNMCDACIGCIVWYLVGFGIAGGGNAFIGTVAGNYALSGIDDTSSSYSAAGYDWCVSPVVAPNHEAPSRERGATRTTLSSVPLCARRISFFFSYTFAAAASTIVSGAVAERCQLGAYIVYTIFITGFVYPVVVHWVWNTDGFMSAFNPNHIIGGVIDFAGSGVVHMTGGVAGLVGAKILGPRLGRFTDMDQSEFEGHSTPLQIIGTFLLWFGWYGFNGGSTLYLHGYGRDMARVAVTTTISAATAGCTGLMIKKFLPAKMGGSGLFEVGHVCNSVLGGLVGITAGCASVSAPGSLAIGFLAAFVYHGASCLMRKMKIDDPLDAFAVHGACGFWGCIAVGLFCTKGYSYAPNSGSDMFTSLGGTDSGAFAGGSKGAILGAELVGLIIEILWVGTLSIFIFGLLKLTGMLRTRRAHKRLRATASPLPSSHAPAFSVCNLPLASAERPPCFVSSAGVSEDVEKAGLDDSKHGGSAYRKSNEVSVAPVTIMKSSVSTSEPAP